MKAIIWTFLWIIFVVLVFVGGYTLGHQGIPIKPIDQAIDKVTNYCGDKKGKE